MPTDILVQSLIFNTDLHKQAVKIIGADSQGRAFNGVFLVKQVEPQKLSVVSYLNENFTITVSDLHSEERPSGLIITVL